MHASTSKTVSTFDVSSITMGLKTVFPLNEADYSIATIGRICQLSPSFAAEKKQTGITEKRVFCSHNDG